MHSSAKRYTPLQACYPDCPYAQAGQPTFPLKSIELLRVRLPEVPYVDSAACSLSRRVVPMTLGGGRSVLTPRSNYLSVRPQVVIVLRTK